MTDIRERSIRRPHTDYFRTSHRIPDHWTRGAGLTKSELGHELDAQPGEGLAGEIRYYDLKAMPDRGAAE